MKTLVLGGVKSGKSRFAEQLVQDWVNQEENDEQGVIYLATAQSFDDEFTRRIERHRHSGQPTDRGPASGARRAAISRRPPSGRTLSSVPARLGLGTRPATVWGDQVVCESIPLELRRVAVCCDTDWGQTSVHRSAFFWFSIHSATSLHW